MNVNELFSVRCYNFNGGRVFALRGELDAYACPGLADQLVGPVGSLIVLDLYELTFVDSSGLGTFHKARRMAIENGGTLVVSRPQPIVQRVLEITGLDTWITAWNPDWSIEPGIDCA
jgi:anti-anti-sigma factor